MAETIANMMVRIGADTSEFQKSIKNVNQTVQSVGDGMKKFGDNMKNTGNQMTKWVTGGIAGATAGLAALVTKTAETADQFAKNARKVGVSTESFQEYSYALGQTGLSQEQVEKTLGRLNTRIGEARNGSEKYTEALKRAGVDMEALKNGTLTTDEAMMQAVEGLNNIQNAQDRASATTDLFGKKIGRELASAVAGGASSLEAGRAKIREYGVISDETAVKAEAFNDKMEDLQSAMKGAFQEVGTNFIPVLTDKLIPALEQDLIPLIVEFGKKLASIAEWFADLSPAGQKITVAIIAIAAAIPPLIVIIGTLVSSIGTIITTIGAASAALAAAGGASAVLGTAFAALTGPIGIAIAAIIALVAAGVTIYKNWDVISKKTKQIWKGIKNFFKTTLNQIRTTFKIKMKEVKSNITSSWKKVEKFLKSVSLQRIGKKIIVSLINGIKKISRNVKDNVVDLWERARDYLDGITLTQLGRDIIQGLIRGIGDRIAAVRNKVREVGQAITSKIKSILGIHSPSRVMQEVGRNTGEGLIQGINNKTRDVGTTSQDMGATVISEIESGLSNTSGIENKLSNIVKVFESKSKEVSKASKSLGSTISSTVSSGKQYTGPVTGSTKRYGNNTSNNNQTNTNKNPNNNHSNKETEKEPSMAELRAIIKRNTTKDWTPDLMVARKMWEKNQDLGYQKYHDGGPVGAGLNFDEVPAILQKGEFVLSKQMISDIKGFKDEVRSFSSSREPQAAGMGDVNVNLYGDFHISSDMDIDSVANQLGERTKRTIRSLGVK